MGVLAIPGGFPHAFNIHLLPGVDEETSLASPAMYKKTSTVSKTLAVFPELPSRESGGTPPITSGATDKFLPYYSPKTRGLLMIKIF
jgi:hypothetical protein